MQVPFLDIAAQNQSIWTELSAAADEVMTTGRFVLGPAVERFEREFAAYCGTQYAVGVNNGTSALHMALVALDIGPGDEVITTPHTWISTAWAISYAGATPVFVDIDPAKYNLDPRLVESAITSRTKALLPVHLYGRLAAMDELREIAERHQLLLIEDAAQAHGAMSAGRRAGELGDVGCFSFYPGKNLGAFGEAGAVITDRREVAERIRRLRDHAQDGRHRHVELGFNTRMEGLQGAVVSVKLRHLDRWNADRRMHAARYAELLADVPALGLPEQPADQSHVWHLFVVRVLDRDRDALREALHKRGVATAIHYPTPVPLQPAYAHLGYQPGDFPVAEQVMGSCLSLPMFAELSDAQMRYVAESVKDALATAGRSS